MDGYEVCQKLRANEKTKEVPIIFLTAKTQKDDILKGFEVGGQDYITKPFDARELMERVKTQLELKTQREILKDINITLEQRVAERTKQLDDSNQKLEKANKKLLALDDAKNNFLDIISHEIRTPINGIMGSAYYLTDMIQDPELMEFIGMLKESTERLNKFTQIALDITQIQTHGPEMEKQKLSLNEIVKFIIQNFNTEAENKNLTIVNTLVEPVSILGIKNYITKTIDELIANALKFSYENTVIEVQTKVENDKIKLSVSNSGKKIPAEKIEEITKPFALANDHYDKDVGLGLSLVKSALDLHNASLEIVSDDDKTIFTISFKPI